MWKAPPEAEVDVLQLRGMSGQTAYFHSIFKVHASIMNRFPVTLLIL